MDYFCLLQSAVSYIESRVRSDIDCGALSRSFGVSEAHFRDVFASRVGVPPGRYALSRRVANAAFEISHTDRRISDIALDYGFDNPDTFTRAFRRETGMTPSSFRSSRVPVGRVLLAAGAYGPGLKKPGSIPIVSPATEETMTKARIEKAEGACVLYGVQKVQYRYEECTPFPAALRSCLNYMGQEIRYAYLMAATGAAFRLRWHTSQWDGGNVDIMNVFDAPEESLVRGFRAAGRSFTVLRRESGATKADFIAFIRAEIDEGRPVIAFGIIGPPEACIITGYRVGGDTLLGWNFFQENPEFGGGCAIDESGYFMTDGWWENPSTVMLMSIGEACGELPDASEIMRTGLEILERELVTHANGCTHHGGQAAYRAWAAAFSNDADFPAGMPLPQLFERLMCNNDAFTMVAEGRAYAAVWMKEVADSLEGSGKSELAELARKAAECFDGEYALVSEMFTMPEYREPGEKQALALADPAFRKKLVERILRAAELDRAAADAIRDLLGRWR
jgi:AraC-like DNA-binding protein